MKYLQSILAVVTIIAFVFGAYSYIDVKYARADQVQLVEQRLDIKILRDASRDYRSDIQYIERLYHNKPVPVDDKMKLQVLKEKKGKVDSELNMRIQELIRKN